MGVAAVGFTGFPPSGPLLYRRLAEDNTKKFWREHKSVYDREVRAPMEALAAALAQEFGDIQVLVPRRDTRASNDKSPYKTYQGAYVDIAPSVGFWVQLDSEGLYASGRYYPWSPEQVARYRDAADAERTGAQLSAQVTLLRANGFAIGGDRLRTRPRGFAADHPRVDLLRHRKLDVGRRYGAADGIHTAAAADLVADTWRATRPLLDWAARL